MPSPEEAALRLAVVETMQTMAATGLNRGTAGNCSARLEEHMLISPSGVPANRLRPEDVVCMDMDAPTPAADTRPSSEWQLHSEILRQRPDVDAIVHCHARFATVLSCLREPIPPIHYMVGLCGASEVPLAPYARFGTTELARSASRTLETSNACLLANHGMVACGRSLSEALTLCEEIEEMAAIAWHARAAGGGRELSAEQMDEVLAALADYRADDSTP